MSAKRKPVRPSVIVSVATTREDKNKFDALCFERGMLIKTVLAKLLAWFDRLDMTEQGLLMDDLHEEDTDAFLKSGLLSSRKSKRTTKSQPGT